ncbi:MAG: hypothetical protein EOP84_18645 [Verrucomicrobiaceae bacterium]|nr:MAG: hypothetical protein EOP84_18645 [Verrucomicrobiaceae bacterium]
MILRAYRLDAAHNSFVMAWTVGLCAQAAKQDQPDLGIGEMEEYLEDARSIATPNFSRAWLRLNAVLLLEEQVDVIQKVRREMKDKAADVSGSFASDLVSGALWQYEGRIEDQSFTLRLTNQPQWVGELQSVNPPFVLPLDGSRRWESTKLAAAGSLP